MTSTVRVHVRIPNPKYRIQNTETGRPKTKIPKSQNTERQKYRKSKGRKTKIPNGQKTEGPQYRQVKMPKNQNIECPKYRKIKNRV